ncbi:hypothetical protein DFH28DRAFT_1107294, partial [Melampsora americana]
MGDSEEEHQREDSEEERRQEDSERPPSPDQLQGGSVNPIQSLFRSAVPSIPSVNLPMSPEDRAKFDQVANIFSLEPSYRAEALRLGSITGDDNRYWTILCLQQQARQQVAKQGASLHNDWTPDTNLPEQLKKIIRRTLGDPSIESYTETLNSNKVIIPGSFHRKAMLLKEIWFTQSKINSKQPQVEVPALGSLLGQLNFLKLYNFFDPSESCTEKELQRDVDTKTQARFAYLRMAIGIYNETSPAQRKANGGLTHWRTIDRKLAELRNKSHEYRRAFNAIVLARDQGLFNGKNRWDEIKLNDQFQIPSEEDVVTAIPYLPPNSSHPVLSGLDVQRAAGGDSVRINAAIAPTMNPKECSMDVHPSSLGRPTCSAWTSPVWSPTVGSVWGVGGCPSPTKRNRTPEGHPSVLV